MTLLCRKLANLRSIATARVYDARRGARAAVSARTWRRAATMTVLLSTACARQPLPTDVAAPGEPARVVLTSSAVAGGRSYFSETRVDSATAHYLFTTCDDAGGGGRCPTERTREGTVLGSILQALFVESTGPAMRRVNATYRRPSNITPPDPGGSKLEIIANGRRRSVEWDHGVNVPDVVHSVGCLLQAARGDLILCD